MPEKTEWEVVDTPSSQQHQQHQQQHAYGRPNLQQIMKALLGRWWLGKILGVLTVASVVLVLFATLAGVFVVLLGSAAALAVGMSKIKQWTKSRNGIRSS